MKEKKMEEKMKIINSIQIQGYINFVKTLPTKTGKKLTTFSLSVYAGKVNNKSAYSSIKCVYFGEEKLSNKEQYVIVGKLQGKIYKDKKNIIIIVDEINAISSKKEDTGNDIDFNQVMNDDIPF